MADTGSSPQTRPESNSSSNTTVVTVLDDTNASERTQETEVPVLKLRLKRPKTDRKVQWTNETVDNEHMNKKKSKCCCVFTKPRVFGDSSSSESSDDECDHCHGHVERKKKLHVPPPVETSPENPEAQETNPGDPEPGNFVPQNPEPPEN